MIKIKNYLSFFFFSLFLFNLTISERSRLLSSRILSKSHPSQESVSDSNKDISETQSHLKKPLNQSTISDEDEESPIDFDLEERQTKKKVHISTTFKKCKLKIESNFNVISKLAKQSISKSKSDKGKKESREDKFYIAKIQHGQEENNTIYHGVKIKGPVEIMKPVYFYYLKDLPNVRLLDPYIPLMPDFMGCRRTYHTNNSKVIKTLELLYEEMPYWGDYFTRKQRPVHNLMMVEMVHQLFIYFQKLFKIGFYVKNFDSKFIGVREVDNIYNYLQDVPKVYQTTDLAFVFRSVEAFSYKCNLNNEEAFIRLQAIFQREKQRDFSIKNEHIMEVCKQMNLFNLLKMLELSLFKASSIGVVKDTFFLGCLEEEEDMGHACPPVVHQLLGRTVNGYRFQSTKNQQIHLDILRKLRKNFLQYKTESFQKWLSVFVVHIIQTFKSKPVKALPSLSLDPEKIKGLISKFQNSINQIGQIRNSTGDQNKFNDELQLLLQSLEKLKLLLGDDYIDDSIIGSRIGTNNLNKSLDSLQFSKSSQSLSQIDGKSDHMDMSRLTTFENVTNEMDSHEASQKMENPRQTVDDPSILEDGVFDKRDSSSRLGTLDFQKLVNPNPTTLKPVSDLELENELKSDMKDIENINRVTENKGDKSSSKHDKTLYTESMSYQFDEDEEIAFVNRVDNSGVEYLSMEINMSMFNPEAAGILNYRDMSQDELNAAIQQYFIEKMSQDEELNKHLKIEAEYMII